MESLDTYANSAMKYSPLPDCCIKRLLPGIVTVSEITKAGYDVAISNPVSQSSFRDRERQGVTYFFSFRPSSTNAVTMRTLGYLLAKFRTP
jgi:hypothetical protein